MAGEWLGSALVLAGEKLSVSLVTLKTLGLFLRFSGQSGLRNWHLLSFNCVRGCPAALC